jgi:activator of HSP90 ATPase
MSASKLAVSVLVRVTASLLWLSSAIAAAGDPDTSAGLSGDAQAIHQEIVLPADCARVYHALTDTRSFDAVTRLSDAVTLVTAPNAKATVISAKVGGPFTLFGGYITGRNLQMEPGQRLVQAWRADGWEPGDYSVVRFDLRPQGAGCQIVFDHRGFPKGQGASLAYGWRVHYWEPLAKLLARHELRR